MEDRILIDVEYLPRSDYLRIRRKRSQIYCGVTQRQSDGITCLVVKNINGARKHNIEVGFIQAITVNGVRHIMETPEGRWRLRAQEIVRAVEGKFSEGWAEEYFDVKSRKYFKTDPSYAPTVTKTADKSRAAYQVKPIRYSREDAVNGCFAVLILIVLIVVVAVYFL